MHRETTDRPQSRHRGSKVVGHGISTRLVTGNGMVRMRLQPRQRVKLRGAKVKEHTMSQLVISAL
jgi:hypothetical protein